MTGEALPPEEQARADCYALLAQVFYAPPGRALLDSIARMQAVDDGTAMAGAWRDFAASAAGADPDALREEYESLFVGTGRAEVTLYTGAYTLKGSLDNPLVAIRDFLDAQRLARKQSVHEPEDHVAALCEVMRHLILRDDVAAQRTWFASFLWPAAVPLCNAISRHAEARFYAGAAKFAKSFLEIEHTAFEID